MTAAANRAVVWYVGGTVAIAAILAAAVAVNAFAVFAVIASIGALVLVFERPLAALLLSISVDALGLPLILVGVDRGVLHIGVFALQVVAAAVCVSRARGRASRAATWLLAGLFVLLLWGSVGAWHQVSLNQQFAGARLVATPVLAALIGLTASTREQRAAMKYMTLLLVASALAAAVERSIGVAGLLRAGLDYGTTVRGYNGEIRAPGLFTSNYSMGAFASVVGALGVFWWPPGDGAGRAAMWRVTSLIAAIACLLLGIYRTGIVVLLVAIALWFLYGQRKHSSTATLGVLAGVAFTVYYVVSQGLDSTSSLVARGQIWSDLLARQQLSLLGNGLGSAGAATASRYASSRVTVDNYFLNLVYQFGVLGILIPLALLVAGCVMTARARRIPGYTVGFVLLATVVAFYFVEFWEYTAAMSAALWAATAGVYARTEQVEDGQRQPDLDDREAVRT